MEKTNETLRLEEAMNPKTDGLEDFYGERLTAEDALKARKVERRLKWKLDLTVLPLLSTVYFLAQMVCDLLIRIGQSMLPRVRDEPILVMQRSQECKKT